MYLRGPVQPPVSALLVKAATALKISASVIWKILCSCQKQQTIRGQTYVFAAGAIKVTFLHVSMWRLIGASLRWTFLSLTCSLTGSFTLFSLNNLFFSQSDEFLHEKKKWNIIFWTEVASLLLSLPLHLLSPLPLKALLPPLSTFTRNVQTNFIYSRVSSSVSVSCVFFRSSPSNRAAGAPGCRSSQWWSPWRPPSSTPTSPRAAPPRTQNTSEHTRSAVRRASLLYLYKV